MKKFTLFLGALLISMMSMATEVTVSIADYAAANGWENSKQYTSLTMDEVVTVTANPTTGTYNNTGKYYTNGNNWRMYQNENPKIVITAAEGHVLTSVTFTYQSDKTGVMVDAAGKQVLSGEAYSLGNVASATFSVSNTTADVTNGQARISSITVSYEAGEGGSTTPEEPETPEVTADTITCAEAATIAAAANYVGTDTVTVVGYVTELGSAKDDGSKQCFYMADTKDGGKVFMAYWAFVSKLYVVGDKVAVTGILKNFNGTIEIVDGQSALLEAAAGETPDDDDETPANVTFDFTTKEGLEALGIAYPTTDAGNGACSTDLEEGKAYSQNGISLTAKYGSTATRIWLAASGKLDLRHYKGGVLTFAAPAGKVITNIVFDGADVSGLTTLVDKAWTGNASTVEIPAAADAKTIKINTIKVHVADASSDYVATPVISGETNFLENTTVTITAEEGLEVYYTLDGTDPTKASTKYTAPFELTATTTVKAIAYNGDKASAVVEKKFTKMTILTCAEAVVLCTNPATPGQHIIRGYITEMIEAYNDQYKNITFWMADTPDGGQVLQAFRVKPVSDVEQALKVGDFVEVIGSLILYNGETPEVNAGGSVKLITAGDTAVDNLTVNQQTTKFIENGQLVILKDGVRYNALGQVIK